MSVTSAQQRPSADRRSSSAVQKRASILPKPQSMSIDPSAIIAQHAQLTGSCQLTLGANVVLHPHSKISSAVAPVTIGDGVIVYERAKIGLGASEMAEADSRRSSILSSPGLISRSSMGLGGVVLGNVVVVETGAVVEAAEVGEGTVIEAGARIGRGSIIGNFCLVGAHVIVPENTRMPDHTVWYGDLDSRIDRTLQLRPHLQQSRTQMHERQIDAFRKLLPNKIAAWT